jgi:hypothetical protein
MELAELSAIGLTFLLKLLVIWARHHFHQMQGTNYCSDLMDGYSFIFGCTCRGAGRSLWRFDVAPGRPESAR